MSALETLEEHQRVCDALYELILEENRFLQKQKRPPGEDLLARKRQIRDRLDQTLKALKAAPKADTRTPPWRTALDRARTRILQILQLDKENEQLLLRHSLSSRIDFNPGPSASASMLGRIYART